MPRKFRRYSKRKNYLSTRRIFSYRSARSQANQIYLLKKRLSRVYKQVKPEIKTIITPSYTSTFTSDALADIFMGIQMPGITQGPGDSNRIGNNIKIKSYSVPMMFQYYNDSTTGYHNTESAGACVRVFAIQRKGCEAVNESWGLVDFFGTSSYTGSEYDTLGVKPFIEGITERFKILCDYRFTLTSDRNQKQFKLKLKNVSPIRYEQDGSKCNYVKVYIVVCGIHWDTDFKEYVKANYMVKTAFTDA